MSFPFRGRDAEYSRRTDGIPTAFSSALILAAKRPFLNARGKLWGRNFLPHHVLLSVYALKTGSVFFRQNVIRKGAKIAFLKKGGGEPEKEKNNGRGSLLFFDFVIDYR